MQHTRRQRADRGIDHSRRRAHLRLVPPPDAAAHAARTSAPPWRCDTDRPTSVATRHPAHPGRRRAAALSVAGLALLIAWLCLPGWWTAPIAGSFAPAHMALVAYAVALIVLALTYVPRLDRRLEPVTGSVADRERTLTLNTLF